MDINQGAIRLICKDAGLYDYYSTDEKPAAEAPQARKRVAAHARLSWVLFFIGHSRPGVWVGAGVPNPTRGICLSIGHPGL